MSRPGRWTRAPGRPCWRCCAGGWRPGPPVSWSPMRPATPAGRTGSCSCATAGSSTRPAGAPAPSSCWSRRHESGGGGRLLARGAADRPPLGLALQGPQPAAHVPAADTGLRGQRLGVDLARHLCLAGTAGELGNGPGRHRAQRCRAGPGHRQAAGRQPPRPRAPGRDDHPGRRRLRGLPVCEWQLDRPAAAGHVRQPRRSSAPQLRRGGPDHPARRHSWCAGRPDGVGRSAAAGADGGGHHRPRPRPAPRGAAHPARAVPVIDGQRRVFVALPDSASDWEPPLINGLSSQARDATRPTPQEQATQAANLTLVVGFAGAQMALLVSAAFAVGARRQRRELAMIAAVGASNRQVARVVLANGILLGAVAGTLGVGLGCVSFWSSRGLVERLVDHPLADTGAPVPHLVGIAAFFAVMVGLLTALGPARGVSRQPVRAALTGREVAAGTSARRLALAGLVGAGGGAALAAYAASPQVADVRLATAGAGLVLLGVAACAPALVGTVGHLAATMPLPGRLALRHAARHPLRTGAAVAAVGAAIAGSVGMILFSAADSTPPAMPNGPVANRSMRTGQVLLAARDAAQLSPHDLTAIAAGLPLRALVPIRTVPVRPTFSPAAVRAAGPDTPPPAAPQAVAVGGHEIIHAVTGRDPDAATLSILRHGGAVSFYPQWDHGGTVRLVTDSGRTIQ